MSVSSSEIEREVEASRADLEGTVEALKDKMSVGQMVNEASRYLGDNGAAEMLSTLGQQARANPLPLALVGVGLVWLMSGRGQPSLRSRRSYGSDRDYGGTDYESLGDDEYRRTFGERSVYAGASHSDYSGYSTGMDESWESSEGGQQSAGGMRRRLHDARDMAAGAASGIGSTVSSVAGAVGSAASGVASAVGTAASVVGSAASGLGQVASTVGRTAYSAAGTVAGGARGGAGAAWRGGTQLGTGAYSGASRVGSGAYYSASSFGRGARRTFADVLETEPLALAAVGVAVGAAIGAFLPGTDVEDRYLGETRDRLRQDAEAFAREKLEQGKAVAGEALRTVKEEAQSQGLTSTGEDSIVGKVSQVARTTVERVRESAAEKGLMGSAGSDDTSSSGGSSDASSGGSAGSGMSGSSAGSGGYNPTV